MAGEVPAGAVTVGADGSGPSMAAVRWAVREAASTQRPLCLLHAYEPHRTVYSSVGAMVPPLALAEALDEAAETVLRRALHAVHEQVRDQALPKVPTTMVLASEDPREALVESGRTAALVVVASRGRGAMTSLLLGSTSVWVCQHAPCPVVVVRGEGEAAGEPAGPPRVVVGTDGSEQCAAALAFAAAYASRHGCELDVVRCLPADVGGAGRDPEGTVGTVSAVSAGAPERAVSQAAVDSLRATHPGLRAGLELHRGSAAGYLTHLSHGARLVVLGSTVRHGPGPWGHGGVRRAVAEHAACSVAVVPAHAGGAGGAG